jgi:hypothetical protein
MNEFSDAASDWVDNWMMCGDGKHDLGEDFEVESSEEARVFKRKYFPVQE